MPALFGTLPRLLECSLLEAPYCLLGGLTHDINLAQQTSQPDSKGMKAIEKHITIIKRIVSGSYQIPVLFVLALYLHFPANRVEWCSRKTNMQFAANQGLIVSALSCEET